MEQPSDQMQHRQWGESLNDPTRSAKVGLCSDNNGTLRGVQQENVIRLDHYFLGKLGAQKWREVCQVVVQKPPRNPENKPECQQC